MECFWSKVEVQKVLLKLSFEMMIRDRREMWEFRIDVVRKKLDLGSVWDRGNAGASTERWRKCAPSTTCKVELKVSLVLIPQYHSRKQPDDVDFGSANLLGVAKRRVR